MPVLFLKILGGFRARLSSGETAEIPIRKGRALLAYLALNPDEAIARSKLSALLWGDHGDERARSNLRETLNVLRKALGPAQDQVLCADRQSIALDGAALDVDALTFQNLIARGTAADLETAVSLYRGDLLDGLDISDPGFQAWLEEERRRFSDMMAGALDTLIVHKRTEGLAQDAILHGHRLLALEPLREDVHRVLIALHAELGRRHAAHQQYQRCRELLASELNVAPEPETEALYQTLLNGDGASAGPAELKSALVSSRREARGVAATLGEGPRLPSAEMAGVLQGWSRRTLVAGRVLVVGGVAALAWLLAWGYPAVQLPPDLLDRLRIDALSSDGLAGVSDGVLESSAPAGPHRMAPSAPAEISLAAAASGGLPDDMFKPSWSAGLYRGSRSLGAEPPLVVASIDDSWGALEGMSESSGPARLYRLTSSRPVEPSLDVASFSDLSGVLARVTGYSRSIVPAETGATGAGRSIAHDARLAMQREADGRWSELADSWDLPAVSAFRTHFPEAGQVAEADRRIAFLIMRHSEAQAELNRLGYDAGPVDGVWGPRSARAMRAFQSDHGLAPEGVVSKALLDRLKTASPTIATATTATPSPRLQPVRPEPEVAVAPAPPPAPDGIPDGGHWTAAVKSVDGTRIIATATRQGDSLKFAFDVDHRDAGTFGSQWPHRYTLRCTAIASRPVIECLLPDTPFSILGGRVFGTFPRLTYEFMPKRSPTMPLPNDIVMEFRPGLKAQDLKIAEWTISGPASKGPTQSDAPPKITMATGLDPLVEGGKKSESFDGIWVGQTGEGFWKVTLVVNGRNADLRIDHPTGIIKGAGKLNDDGNIPVIIARGLKWEDRWISGSVHRISINGTGWAGEATINLRKYQG